MSDEPQAGGPGWPFGQGFDLSQMMSQLQGFLNSEGPVNWEVAHQVGGAVAISDPETGEQSERGWNAADGDRITELARLAQSHVADASGLVSAHAIPIRVIARREWTSSTLHDLKRVLEALAAVLNDGTREGHGEGVAGAALDAREALDGLGIDPDALAPFGIGEAELGKMLAAMAPVLLGVHAGTMVGTLAHQALGRFDMILPLDAEPEIAFVLANIDEFTSEWSLERDDVYLSIALRETTRAAQRTVTWVRHGLVERAISFVSGYSPDASAIEERLAGLDLSDPSFAEQIGDPIALLGMMRTPEQNDSLDDLQRFIAVIEGYTDTVVASIGERLISSHVMVDEALRRRRLDRGKASEFTAQMLGLELTRDLFERGRAFCAGVVEREGLEGLNRLWRSADMLPTPSELDAPGLWLARIEL